jgi:hypothetical protein
MEKVKNSIIIYCILLVILTVSSTGSVASSSINRITLPIVFNNFIPVTCVPSASPGFNRCAMDNGVIFSTVDVSQTWTDVTGSAWYINKFELGTILAAAPNLSQFYSNHDAEGISFGVSNNFAQLGGYIEILDYYTMGYYEDCSLIGRYDWNNGIYRGKYDRYNNCGTNGYESYVFAGVDINDPTSVLILMRIQVDPVDTGFANQALDSFYVIVR